MVIADLNAGGAQRVFTRIASAWAARGYNICVVTMSAPDTDFFVLPSNVQRIAIGGLGQSSGAVAAIVANLGRLRDLRRAIRRVNTPRVLSFTGAMNVMTVLATRGLGLEVVISERNDPARQSLGRVWDWLRRLTYGKADRVTTNSRGAIESLKAYVPGEKLAYVPNPIDLDIKTEAAKLPVPTILNIGRLNPQKAQDVLIDAFVDVAAENPDWRLMIVGQGEQETALREQAQRLRIGGRVDFVERVDDPYLYYNAAHIFALPSRFEGTPNVLLEAMTARLPAIVSDACGGALDYVEDGVSGLVVRVGDKDSLAAALRRLINDAALRQRLGDAGYARIEHDRADVAIATWTEAVGLPLPHNE